jgi:phospholipid/cholesterol/gamma-HCH transport system substrate-binding protein
MQTNRTMEILVGAFMLLGLLALFFLAMNVSSLARDVDGGAYRVTARFDNIGSLTERAKVTVAGVRIGRVEKIGYDSDTFEAVVTLAVDNRYNAIPDDTFAKIYTAGLLGEQYVGLEPGGSESSLKNGDEIAFTQSALVLEEMIGQFLFSQAQEKSDDVF